MDPTFFESSTTSAITSPVNVASPAPSASLEDLHPHVHSAPLPQVFTPAAEFDSSMSQKPFFSADHFVGDGFDPDYQYTAGSAPEMSHMDVASGQEAYWSPSPEGPIPSASSVHGAFLTDLYGESLTGVVNNGIVPECFSASSSPRWSSEEHSEHLHQSLPQEPSIPSPPYYHINPEPYLIRRASFPSYIPHDREDVLPPVSTLMFDHYEPPSSFYGEDHSLAAETSALHHQPYLQPPVNIQPAFIHVAPQDFEDLNPKSECNSPAILPQPDHYFRPVSPIAYSPPAVPSGATQITHTDDAASKETQYLRRRCFNCRTTEPPSWRRSTLNLGKIVSSRFLLPIIRISNFRLSIGL